MGRTLAYECEICQYIVSDMETFVGHKLLAHSAVSITLKMPCEETGTQTDQDFDIDTFG